MSESLTHSLETRKKRARFRSWRRGQKELDIILGKFADVHLEDFDEAFLKDFETILDFPDPDLFAWLIGSEAIPKEVLENPVMQILVDEHLPKD